MSIRLPGSRREGRPPITLRRYQTHHKSTLDDLTRGFHTVERDVEKTEVDIHSLPRDSFKMENTYITRLRRVAQNPKATDADRRAAQRAVDAFDFKEVSTVVKKPEIVTGTWSAAASSSWTAFHQRQQLLAGVQNAGLMRRQAGQRVPE